MKFEGKIEKTPGEKYWSVSMEVFGIYTQGKTKKDAYAMAKDALESLVNRNDFSVSILPDSNNSFYVSADNNTPLIGLLLLNKRRDYGLTIMDVAERMGSKSPTAYARYESGKVQPSLDKLDQILKAIDENLEPIFKVG